MAAAATDNLPRPLSAFIGRGRELSALRRLLAAHRLVTLTGPGGSGKTRLAVEVASGLRNRYEGGVWFVDFAPLGEPSLVPQTAAAALGLREQGGRAWLDELTAQLASSRLLLILDNCEHLIAACAALAERLLEACPGLRILATSRESLGIQGEVIWTAPPLSLPEKQPWRSPRSPLEALPAYLKSEAVQLFVDRATNALPDFELTPENGPWVADICRRVDGMPLAIELAAARVRGLSLQQIAERLADRFGLLTGGDRNAPPRHKTLAATLDWSYSLLSAAEQKVLRRLSVFAGGATVEAAEAVCSGGGVEGPQVLDTLSHLVDKSLLIAGPGPGGMRYGLLETIRAYALERLVESGEAPAVRRAHAACFLEFAQRAVRTDSMWYWPAQVGNVEQLDAEHENLRAALAWAQSEAGSRDLGLRLAAAMAQYWQMRGFMGEGLAWLQQVLLGLGPGTEAARAEALYLAGYLHMWSDELDRAAASFEEALELYRQLGESGGVAWQLTWLAWTRVAQGEYARAAGLAEQAFRLQQELGDDFGAAVALVPAGEAAHMQGDLAAAREFYEAGLALMNKIGNPWGAGRRLTRLGQVTLAQGDLPGGRALIEEGLADCLEGGDNSGVAMALAALAGAAREQGQPDRAVRLLAAVAALREATGTPIWFLDRLTSQRDLLALRAELAETAFARLWAEGQAMTLGAASDYARAGAEPPEVERREKGRPGGLTAREREVAGLIAQGKSNREIAREMTLSVRTVETYATRILGKLGLESRVQIATWAIANGLKPGPA